MNRYSSASNHPYMSHPQVPRTVIRRVSSDQDKIKLEQYELRSYVEDSKRLTWCPAPDCQHAVECVKDIGPDEPLDVLCKCGSSFCFSCKEEAHRPVSPMLIMSCGHLPLLLRSPCQAWPIFVSKRCSWGDVHVPQLSSTCCLVLHRPTCIEDLPLPQSLRRCSATSLSMSLISLAVCTCTLCVSYRHCVTICFTAL